MLAKPVFSHNATMRPRTPHECQLEIVKKFLTGLGGQYLYHFIENRKTEAFPLRNKH